MTKYDDWLADYALFCALRDHFGTDNWREWDEEICIRREEATIYWTQKLKEKIDQYILIQWQLHEAYAALKKKAKSSGISLIGDLPFYPSVHSPLVWANQDIFQIERDGTLEFVSGIPKSAFGRQVWGHPLYQWAIAKEKIISFWETRIAYQATLFDCLRFDHMRGFFLYGEIYPRDERNDRSVQGPGADVFRRLVIFAKQKGLTVFAEDDDELPELQETLKSLGLAGIKLFRWDAAIVQYPEQVVAYSTTHDTETLLGELSLLSIEQKQQLATEAQVAWDADDKIFAKNIREALLQSPAQMVIIPIQDWLLITDRINIPGTEKEVGDTNWQFRLPIPIEELPTSFDP